MDLICLHFQIRPLRFLPQLWFEKKLQNCWKNEKGRFSKKNKIVPFIFWRVSWPIFQDLFVFDTQCSVRVRVRALECQCVCGCAGSECACARVRVSMWVCMQGVCVCTTVRVSVSISMAGENKIIRFWFQNIKRYYFDKNIVSLLSLKKIRSL